MRPASVVFAVVAFAASLTACGGSSARSTAPASRTAEPATQGTTLEVSADPSNRLAFDKRLLSTTAGKVTLIMDNPSQLAHNIALEGKGIRVEGATVGQYQASKLTATLKRGRYRYFCSMPGHRRAGMEGTLIVG